MKQFYRLAWLTLIVGLLISCNSLPPESEDAPVVDTGVTDAVPEEIDETATEEIEEEVEAELEEIEEVAPTPVTVEESAPEPEPAETEEEEESSAAASAVDGPTHTPAASVAEALIERAYDQAKGAEEPLLTVIEYGDFQ